MDYTQEQLAELSDLNVTFIGEIERGHCNPTIDTLNKIAGALNLTLSQLISASETQTAPKAEVEKLLLEYTEKITSVYEEKNNKKAKTERVKR